jgi:hypothetical protein
MDPDQDPFVSQRHGYENPNLHPDPYQNVTDPEHCQFEIKQYKIERAKY